MLLGSTTHFGSLGERMDGGIGNDVLLPTPLPWTHNIAIGGPGKDVIFTLNFRAAPWYQVDQVALDNAGGPSTGIGSCDIEEQLTYDTDSDDPYEGSIGEVSCEIPWPARLSGLDEIVSVEAGLTEDRELTVSANLYNDLAGIKVTAWDDIVEFQASLADDVCICDPVIDPEPNRAFPFDTDLG